MRKIASVTFRCYFYIDPEDMKKSLTLFIFLTPFICIGQWFKPPISAIFQDDEVISIQIFLDPNDLAEILDPVNVDSYEEFPATCIINSSQLNDTIENVGFRIRGNTSRHSAKKSFKVSFNTFVEGRDYYGLEKMNLNGEHNDPSIIRSKLCWDILYDFNVPATRSNHLELYINNEYKGLYIHVEHIDEEFVESRFGNKDGNLYKCLWPSDLVYLGANQEAYEDIYELKTNTASNDYSDLINFIRVVNNAPSSNFPAELEKIFNINNFLKFHAVEVFTGHWDSYAYLKNNFYLYKNTSTGKFEFIPYDMDNTFGIDWFNIDWPNRNIYAWAHDEEYRPLIERLLNIDVYKDRYSYYLNQLRNGIVKSSHFLPKIEQIKTMITPSAERDAYRTYDYGWDFNDFSRSYYQALGAHVHYGLENYITTRHNSLDNQLELEDIAPIIYYTNTGFPRLNANLAIETGIEDENDAVDVRLHYDYNGATGSIAMHLVANGQIDVFQGSIELLSAGNVFYFIEATDENNQTTRYPIDGTISIAIPNEEVTGLYINEIMAGNANTIADEFDEFDDWIELYNASDETIWLGNYFLSDNADVPGKYNLPDESLAANDYLIIWSDDDIDQGLFHAGFKLSKDGEEVLLSRYENNEYKTIDYIRYGAIDSDVSYGKLPDGNGILHLLSPTPGATNLILHKPILSQSDNLTLYPNPFQNYFNIHTDITIKQIRIINLYGQVVYKMHTNKRHFQVHPSLRTGIYFVEIYDVNRKRTVKKIMKN